MPYSKIALFAVCSLWSHFLLAQNTWRAQVLDTDTNLPVVGVNIRFMGSDIGTTTDLEGFFQLEISGENTSLLFTHIGYEDYTHMLRKLPTEIYLVPKVNALEEVVVKADKKITPISDENTLSVSDFEISADKILLLEYHGSFKSRVLSMTDLAGEKIAEYSLKGIRGIEGLYKSCTQSTYLVSTSKAYPIETENKTLSLGKAVSLDTFNRFIRPCRLQMGMDLYFIFEDLNGLRRTITKVNVEEQTRKVLAVIANPQQVENYAADLWIIQAGKGISNIHTNDVAKNQSIRNLQEEADFLAEVFYKPEFPVHLFKWQGRILLFNHPEKRLDVFEGQKSSLQVELPYVEDETWLKKLLYDEVQEQIYALFKAKNKTLLKRLHPIRTSTKIFASIELPSYQVQKIRIHNGVLYYLQHGQVDGQNRQLMKLEF